jgi:uncharacterized SAM-binding protein YcdF (DUF218 family)
MKTLTTLFVLFLFISSANSAEISLGGGHAFTTNDASSGLGDTSLVTTGGLDVQAEVLFNSGSENLKLGIETGYLEYSHAEYHGNPNISDYNRDEFNIPILAVGRYSLGSGFFGELKAGLSLDRITTNADFSGNETTPYIAIGATLGYEAMLSNEFSIDPKVNAYAFFISGAYTQIAPTLNLSYRF